MHEYTVQDLIVESENRQVYGKLYSPAQAKNCPAIILSHGYNGCHADFDAECRYYAAHGFTAYTLDFCGGSTRSRSSGKSTEMTLFTEKADLLAALGHIRALAQVDADRVYLMGGSQGGLVTALAAEERPEWVKGMILYFPAMGIPMNWRSRYPEISDIPEVTDFWGLQLGRAFFASMHDLDAFQVIGGFKRGVLLITGDQDQIVPLSSVEKAAACYEQAELVVLPGEGHGFTPQGNRTAMETAFTWMNR